MSIGDYERNNENNEYKECPYSNKDDVNECIDYFMGECQNSCSFCPLEDKYGREYQQIKLIFDEDDTRLKSFTHGDNERSV